MNTVASVQSNYIHAVWDKVEPFISASLDTSLGDYDTAHIKLLLLQGAQQLLVITDEANEIVGATVVHFINYPNNRVCYVLCVGGKNLMNDQTVSQVADWAKANGATSFRATVREAQARLYKQKAGFEITRYVVEKKL